MINRKGYTKHELMNALGVTIITTYIYECVKCKTHVEKARPVKKDICEWCGQINEFKDQT